MAVKDQDDKVHIIPLVERKDELEQKVQRYMLTTSDLPKNEHIFTRVDIPWFDHPEERMRWEMEEIQRCREGYKGMTGKMYFYFNYCWMENLEQGKITPEYRVADDEWFRRITAAQNSHDYGMICVKRRRAGASWKEAADTVHDMCFTPHFHVGMNSKSERDSDILFKKVLFILDNLPSFLKPKVGARSKNKLEFYIKTKDKNGNVIKRGTQSELIVVPPTDSAYEGMMLGKWICDEAGKIVNLPQMWSYTEDCLMQETKRVGCPVLFGTSGDIGKDGAGLRNMWKHSDVYKLERFFFAGWMGLDVDKFGNDNKEDCIRYIVYERERKKNLSAKEWNDYIQKYPLTVEEAFSQASEGGVGNILLINKQKRALETDPPVVRRGKFALESQIDGSEKVIWVPDKLGDCYMYEPVKAGINHQYIAGCDPADHDNTLEKSSKLSLSIRKRAHGTNRPYLVFEYFGKPQSMVDAYDQCALALMYYNDCKVLIERQRYRMIGYFEERGLKHLIMRTPQGVLRVSGGRINTLGVNMNDTFKDYMLGIIEQDIEENWDLIPSNEFLEECIAYGTRNTDRVISYGLSVVADKELKAKVKRKNIANEKVPSFRFVRNNNGSISRVSPKRAGLTTQYMKSGQDIRGNTF